MRSRVSMLLLLSAASLFATRTAQGSILLELELFNSPGVTTAAAGSNVDIAIFMSPGLEGVSAIHYDVVTNAGVAVLGVNQSISVVPPDTICPAIFPSVCQMSELAPPVLNGNRIDSFNLSTTGLGPTGGRFQIGVARFNFAGPDSVSIVYNIANDNAIPAQPISPRNSTAFQIVPEPTPASLLGLGLGALALAGRRARRARPQSP